jgi:hypothetical protein
MSPLRIKANGTIFNLGPDQGQLITGDNVNVSWTGDGNNDGSQSNIHKNIASVTHEGKAIGKFALPLEGTSTDVIYKVKIPSFEAEHPEPTEVRRSVHLERY